MLFNRWPVLLMLGSMVLPASLCGCRRSVSVASEDRPAPEVVRGQADRDDKPDAGGAGDKEGFRFPDDQGGALLARVLPPKLESASLKNERRQAPPRKPVPPGLEAPAVTMPPAIVDLPRGATLGPKRPPLRPRLVHEEALGSGLEPVLPQAQKLTTGERIRVPGVDVSQPPSLPLLTTQPLPDRASLEDATGEASTAAALSATMPQRTQPVPFQRLSVPDPYENRRPLGAGSSLPEKNDPPVTLPQTPKR